MMFLFLLPPSSSRSVINHVESLGCPVGDVGSRNRFTIVCYNHSPCGNKPPTIFQQHGCRVQALVPTLARQTEQVRDREFVRSGILRCQNSVMIRRDRQRERLLRVAQLAPEQMTGQLGEYNDQRPLTVAITPKVKERNRRCVVGTVGFRI
jgi:hypothetical protein